MKKWFGLAVAAYAGVVCAFGCSEDDFTPPAADAGSDTGPAPQVDASSGGVEAGEPDAATCVEDAGGGPQRLLLSLNGASQSEVVALNLATKQVDGRFFYAGFGATSSVGNAPYVLEQQSDIVVRLDGREPWTAVGSWSVAGGDKPDGGFDNANASAVIVPPCSAKGYLLRFNRNRIAVIDTTQQLDGGVPSSYIDLSSLVSPSDGDGALDVAGGVYVPSRKRMYVLLGNIDQTQTFADYSLRCSSLKPTVIAIDVATDKVVSLGGSGVGGGYALEGFNPNNGGSLAYDAAHDRLLVLGAGCRTTAADGGEGPVARRRIEQVDLATGAVKTLLPLDDKDDYPLSFVYADETHAAVAFASGAAFVWNPSEPTLGPQIPGALSSITHDGQGNLLGIAVIPADGSSTRWVVSVPFSDAGAATKIAAEPFSQSGGFLNGAEVWPRP